MRCEDVIQKLEELSPTHFAQSWDNVGLLVGRQDKEIKSIYICLDATDEALEEASKLSVDMVISHHPMIFKGIKSVCGDHFIGRRIMKLVQQDICYYAMHTNFDIMGMADAAADDLKLRHRQVLDKTYEDDISTEGFGRFGKLPQIMTLRECASYVKDAFGITKVRVFGDPDMEVEMAAVCPGSGGSMIDAALSLQADVYITGDIDHHEGIDAVARGMAIIDAGHYGIEKIFVPYMKEYLKREVNGVLVYTQQAEEPFWYV
ncbi:MAG: Nif3-like dinuclear metal center hexameric protein [Lachnospiraceae bacterium]|nr:Nif3-like dinuclear metal center hexameric protein [Lachnospiraceae bacterium]